MERREWFPPGPGGPGWTGSGGERGTSPVVAIALLLGITVLLALVAAPIVFGAVSEFGSDAPNADFAFLYEEGDTLVMDQSVDDFRTPADAGDGLVTIQLERGDTLDPANVEVRAKTSGGNLLTDTDDRLYAPGDRVRDGDSITITADRGETVQVVWVADDGDESAIIGEFTVDVPDALTPPWVPDADHDCSYIEDELARGNDVAVDGVVVDCDLDQYDIGDVVIRNDGAIVGEVEADGDIDIVDGATYEGDVIAADGGDVTLTEGSTEGTLLVSGDGDVGLADASTVGEDIVTAGDATLDGGSSTTGAVSAGAVDIGGDSTVGAAISATEEVDIDGDSTVVGDVAASDAVTVEDSDVGGTVTTRDGGDVTVTDSVVGGVDPDGEFVCEDSQIDGQRCEEYVSPTVEVTITGTNSPVQQGETLVVEADLENTGFDGKAGIGLHVDGERKDGTEVDLDRKQTTSETFEWETDDADADEYTATVASEDDADSETVVVGEHHEIISVALSEGSGNSIAVDVTVGVSDPDAELLIESLDETGVVIDTTWVDAESDEYEVNGANQAAEVRVTLFDGDGIPRDQLSEDWDG